jgi:hypothetical protein
MSRHDNAESCYLPYEGWLNAPFGGGVNAADCGQIDPRLGTSLDDAFLEGQSGEVGAAAAAALVANAVQMGTDGSDADE